MKLQATEDGAIQLTCEHCGATERLKTTEVGRAFATQFNRFKRQHKWRCEYQARDAKIRAVGEEQTAALIKRLTEAV